jgi:copper chaperone NosL
MVNRSSIAVQLKVGVLVILFVFFAGCTKESASAPSPVELTRDDSCSLCGMIPVKFPGAKAQIHFEGGRMEQFCSTLDFFTYYLSPGGPTRITAIYVNDMGKADHERPAGHWIDARKAHFVFGGDVMGIMGDALVPFALEEGADTYVQKHGGSAVMFEEVTLEMLRPKMRGMSGN